MRYGWAFLAILFYLPAWCGNPQLISDVRYQETAKDLAAYDGNWWAKADRYERLVFFWGAYDCQRWDAHVSTSYNVPEEAFDEMTKYYEAHPAARSLPVVEVWKKVAAHVRIAKTPKGGEVYSNPHSFLNGFWYRSSAESERFGFLEGYLGCLRTYVRGSAESFPKPIHYYDDQIWDYIKARPAAGGEVVADILYRFRDKPKAN